MSDQDKKKAKKKVTISENGRASIANIMIPRLVERLEFSDYHPQVPGYIPVWVNPSVDVVTQGIELTREHAELNLKLYENVQAINARELLQNKQKLGINLIAGLYMLYPDPDELDETYEIRKIEFAEAITEAKARKQAKEVLKDYGLELDSEDLPHDPEKLGDGFEQWKNKIYAWYGAIWSEDKEFGVVTAEDAEKLALESAESDPVFWGWLTSKTQEMIRIHRSKQKK